MLPNPSFHPPQQSSSSLFRYTKRAHHNSAAIFQPPSRCDHPDNRDTSLRGLHLLPSNKIWHLQTHCLHWNYIIHIFSRLAIIWFCTLWTFTSWSRTGNYWNHTLMTNLNFGPPPRKLCRAFDGSWTPTFCISHKKPSRSSRPTESLQRLRTFANRSLMSRPKKQNGSFLTFSILLSIFLNVWCRTWNILHLLFPCWLADTRTIDRKEFRQFLFSNISLQWSGTGLSLEPSCRRNKWWMFRYCSRFGFQLPHRWSPPPMKPCRTIAELFTMSILEINHWSWSSGWIWNQCYHTRDKCSWSTLIQNSWITPSWDSLLPQTYIATSRTSRITSVVCSGTHWASPSVPLLFDYQSKKFAEANLSATFCETMIPSIRASSTGIRTGQPRNFV